MHMYFHVYTKGTHTHSNAESIAEYMYCILRSTDRTQAHTVGCLFHGCAGFISGFCSRGLVPKI